MLSVSAIPTTGVPAALIGVGPGSPSHRVTGRADQLPRFIEDELAGAEVLPRLAGPIFIGDLLLVLLV